jgi:hypothetical protein
MTVMAEALARAGYVKPEPVQRVMSEAEKLARMVLMFYAPGPWSATNKEEWSLCAGNREVTTRALGDQARKVIADLDKNKP